MASLLASIGEGYIYTCLALFSMVVVTLVCWHGNAQHSRAVTAPTGRALEAQQHCGEDQV